MFILGNPSYKELHQELPYLGRHKLIVLAFHYCISLIFHQTDYKNLAVLLCSIRWIIKILLHCYVPSDGLQNSCCVVQIVLERDDLSNDDMFVSFVCWYWTLTPTHTTHNHIYVSNTTSALVFVYFQIKLAYIWMLHDRRFLK